MSLRRFRRTPGGVCSLGLHLVWCPKDRREVLGGPVGSRCGELAEQIAVEHGWEIMAKEIMTDHVHLFVGVGPGDAPPQVLWSPSYFAAWVGYVLESTVRRYIEHQWDAVA